MTDSNYINNNSLEDTIEIIEEEQNDSYSNDDLYNINSWGPIYLLENLLQCMMRANFRNQNFKEIMSGIKSKPVDL